MQSTTATVQISCTTYTNQGVTIGEVFAIPMHERTLYFACAHDWDDESPKGVYDPLCAGTWDSPESAAAEIERRAREAQAPETLPAERDFPVLRGLLAFE